MSDHRTAAEIEAQKRYPSQGVDAIDEVEADRAAFLSGVEWTRPKITSLEHLNELPKGSVIGKQRTARTGEIFYSTFEKFSEGFFNGDHYLQETLLPVELIWTPGDTDGHQ